MELTDASLDPDRAIGISLFCGKSMSFVLFSGVFSLAFNGLH